MYAHVGALVVLASEGIVAVHGNRRNARISIDLDKARIVNCAGMRPCGMDDLAASIRLCTCEYVGFVYAQVYKTKPASMTSSHACAK